MLISEPGKSGFLIPIRQYPLYTAALAQFFRSADSYYLDETNEWSTSVNEIRSILEKTRKEGKTQPKASVIINPGNPTGALLDRKMLAYVSRGTRRRRMKSARELSEVVRLSFPATTSFARTALRSSSLLVRHSSLTTTYLP